MSGRVAEQEPRRLRDSLRTTIGRVLGVGVLNFVLGFTFLSLATTELVFGYPAVAMMLTGPLLMSIGSGFAFVGLVGAGVKLGGSELLAAVGGPASAAGPNT